MKNQKREECACHEPHISPRIKHTKERCYVIDPQEPSQDWEKIRERFYANAVKEARQQVLDEAIEIVEELSDWANENQTNYEPNNLEKLIPPRWGIESEGIIPKISETLKAIKNLKTNPVGK